MGPYRLKYKFHGDKVLPKLLMVSALGYPDFTLSINLEHCYELLVLAGNSEIFSSDHYAIYMYILVTYV